MPTALSADEARAFLRARGRDASDLTPLTGGLWSTTFAFRERGGQPRPRGPARRAREAARAAGAYANRPRRVRRRPGAHTGAAAVLPPGRAGPLSRPQRPAELQRARRQRWRDRPRLGRVHLRRLPVRRRAPHLLVAVVPRALGRDRHPPRDRASLLAVGTRRPVLRGALAGLRAGHRRQSHPLAGRPW